MYAKKWKEEREGVATEGGGEMAKLTFSISVPFRLYMGPCKRTALYVRIGLYCFPSRDVTSGIGGLALSWVGRIYVAVTSLVRFLKLSLATTTLSSFLSSPFDNFNLIEVASFSKTSWQFS